MAEEATNKTYDLSQLTLPEVFVTNAKVGIKIVEEATASHHRYWNAIAAMEEHLAGKKPIPPAELKRQGMDWASNWNFGKAKSKIEQITAESVGLIRSALGILSPSFRRFKPEKDAAHVLLSHLDNDSVRKVFTNKIARVLADTMEFDPRFSTYVNLLEYCSVMFGYGSVVHDRYDWMGNATHNNAIAFEDRSDADDVHCWVVFDELKADRIYRLWMDQKKKQIAEQGETQDGEPSPRTSEGWNLLGLEEALYHAFQGSLNDDEANVKPESWEDVLNHFSGKKGWDASEIRQNLNNIKIAKIYRRELDGKISQTYIAYGNSFASPFSQSISGSKSPNFSPQHIMFQKTRKERVRDRLTLIRDSGHTQTGFIQDLRGIGKQAVENSIAYNRTRNSNETKLLLLGQPVFLRGTANDGRPLKLGVTPGFTLLDPNFVLSDKQFNFDMRQHMEHMRFEEGEYNREVSHHDPKLNLSSRPGKTEVNAKIQETSGAKASKNALKLTDYGQLFTTMVRNLVQLKESIKEGDPGHASLVYFYEELLYEFRDFLDPEKNDSENKKDLIDLLKALIRVELDPALDDIEAIQRALQLATDPFQINRLERMLLLAMGFTRRQVDSMKPLILEQLDGGDDEWMAGVENDMFFTTREIKWSKNQNPMTHLNAHFSKAERVIQNVQQGEDPIRAITFIQNVLSHCQEHLRHMAEHPFYSRFFKRYAEAFKRVAAQVPALEKVAREIIEQRQQAQQQGGQQESPEMVKALADIKLNEFKAMKKEERTDYLTQVRLRQNESQQAHRERLKEQEHSAKLERQASMATLKAQIETVKASLDSLKAA